MNKFTQFELSGGGSLPTIAFGTGTTFFDRGGEVADVVVKGIRCGYRVRKEMPCSWEMNSASSPIKAWIALERHWDCH